MWQPCRYQVADLGKLGHIISKLTQAASNLFITFLDKYKKGI